MVQVFGTFICFDTHTPAVLERLRPLSNPILCTSVRLTNLSGICSISVCCPAVDQQYIYSVSHFSIWRAWKEITCYFQLDGKHIVSGSKDRTIRVWSVENAKATLKLLEGHEVASFLSHFYPIGSALLLAQKLVLSGFGISRRVKHWSSFDGTVSIPPSVSFTSDEKYLEFNSTTLRLANRSSNLESTPKAMSPFTQIAGVLNGCSSLGASYQIPSLEIWYSQRDREAAWKPARLFNHLHLIFTGW